MFNTLFGEGYAFKILIAFIAVFGVLALALWLVRRLGGERLTGGNARGRQPRLAVIDAANVDGRRKLVLVRRDNVEHLLMIGGPSDVVIEPNIVRAAAARETVASRTLPASDSLPRALPLGEGNMWPLQPEPVSRVEPPPPRAEPHRAAQPRGEHAQPPRPPREPDFAPPPQSNPGRDRRAQHDPLSGLADELGRVGPAPEPENFEPAPRPPRREARLRPVPPSGTAPAPAGDGKFISPADQNLADMAQRLEAALRRPNRKEETPPPPPIPKPEQAVTAGEESDNSPVETGSPRPQSGAPVEPPVPVREETRPARSEAKPPPQRSLYDSLEQEMASLLGRPAGKG